MDLIPHNTNFDFLGKRKILLPISVSLVLLILALVPSRLNLGVDFAGGTEIEVKFDQNVSPTEVRQKIESAGFQGAQVQQYGANEDHAFLVKVERISVLTPQQSEALRTSVQTSLAPF